MQSAAPAVTADAEVSIGGMLLSRLLHALAEEGECEGVLFGSASEKTTIGDSSDSSRSCLLTITGVQSLGSSCSWYTPTGQMREGQDGLFTGRPVVGWWRARAHSLHQVTAREALATLSLRRFCNGAVFFLLTSKMCPDPAGTLDLNYSSFFVNDPGGTRVIRPLKIYVTNLQHSSAQEYKAWRDLEPRGTPADRGGEDVLPLLRQTQEHIDRLYTDEAAATRAACDALQPDLQDLHRLRAELAATREELSRQETRVQQARSERDREKRHYHEQRRQQQQQLQEQQQQLQQQQQLAAAAQSRQATAAAAAAEGAPHAPRASSSPGGGESPEPPPPQHPAPSEFWQDTPTAGPTGPAAAPPVGARGPGRGRGVLPIGMPPGKLPPAGQVPGLPPGVAPPPAPPRTETAAALAAKAAVAGATGAGRGRGGVAVLSPGPQPAAPQRHAPRPTEAAARSTEVVDWEHNDMDWPGTPENAAGRPRAEAPAVPSPPQAAPAPDDSGMWNDCFPVAGAAPAPAAVGSPPSPPPPEDPATQKRQQIAAEALRKDEERETAGDIANFLSSPAAPLPGATPPQQPPPAERPAHVNTVVTGAMHAGDESSESSPSQPVSPPRGEPPRSSPPVRAAD